MVIDITFGDQTTPVSTVSVNGHIPILPPGIPLKTSRVIINNELGENAVEWPLDVKNVAMLVRELERLAGPPSVKLGKSGKATLQGEAVLIQPREGYPAVTLRGDELDRVIVLQKAQAQQ